HLPNWSDNWRSRGRRWRSSTHESASLQESTTSLSRLMQTSWENGKNRRIGMTLAIFGLLLAGCLNTPSPSPLPSVAPIVDCLGGLDQATCDSALLVALAAVKPSGFTPTHIWFSSGNLCPAESVMFKPGIPCPYPEPPASGTWVANAEVAFAETDKH